MKKVFLSLATIAFVATGSLTVTSCGGDDDSTTVEPIAKGIKLTLVSDPNNIFAGEAFELSINTADGTPVSGAILYANGSATTIESVDGVFRINGPAGEVVLSAEYEGVMSNEVVVNVKEAVVVPSEGTGTFEFEGKTFAIEQSAIVFRGLAYADSSETTVISQWQIESTSGDHTAIVMFRTPATPAGGQNYNVIMPNATNTTGVAAGIIVGDDLVGESTTNVSVDFSAATTSLTDKICTGAYSGTSDAINGSPFALAFDGKTPVIRNTAKGAKGVSGFATATQGFSVKAENLQVLSKSIAK